MDAHNQFSTYYTLNKMQMRVCEVFDQNEPDHKKPDQIHSNQIAQVLTVAKHCARSPATTLHVPLPHPQYISMSHYP